MEAGIMTFLAHCTVKNETPLWGTSFWGLKIRRTVLSHGVNTFAGNLYTEYQDIKDYSGIINGYQEKIDQISIKYLADFNRILKNICWMYLNISQISVDSGQGAKNLKNR